MFRSNFILCILVICFTSFSGFSWAQVPEANVSTPSVKPTPPPTPAPVETSPTTTEVPPAPEPTPTTATSSEKKEEDLGNSEKKIVALAYTSWVEFADLELASIEDSTQAQFYGLQLSWEKEKFENHWGSVSELSLLFGQANAGGNQDYINYQISNRAWFGASGSYKLAYRPSQQVAFSFGPVALFRQIEWPTEGTGISVKSGAPLNFGIVGDLRLQLTEKWELRQMIGTLAFKASTIWSLGLGFRY